MTRNELIEKLTKLGLSRKEIETYSFKELCEQYKELQEFGKEIEEKKELIQECKGKKFSRKLTRKELEDLVSTETKITLPEAKKLTFGELCQVMDNHYLYLERGEREIEEREIEELEREEREREEKRKIKEKREREEREREERVIQEEKRKIKEKREREEREREERVIQEKRKIKEGLERKEREERERLEKECNPVDLNSIANCNKLNKICNLESKLCSSPDDIKGNIMDIKGYKVVGSEEQLEKLRIKLGIKPPEKKAKFLKEGEVILHPKIKIPKSPKSAEEPVIALGLSKEKELEQVKKAIRECLGVED